MRTPALAILAAAGLAGCASMGESYRVVSASPTTITVRYKGDESLAAGRAQDHCAIYNRRAVLARVTPEGDDTNLAIYDCVV